MSIMLIAVLGSDCEDAVFCPTILELHAREQIAEYSYRKRIGIRTNRSQGLVVVFHRSENRKSSWHQRWRSS